MVRSESVFIDRLTKKNGNDDHNATEIMPPILFTI